MRHVVLVDAYAPARGLAPAFREAGHDCVRVQSTAEVPRAYRGSLDLEAYAANIVHRGDLAETARLLSAYEPVAVLAGGELGVELADALSEELGLPSNGTELSRARRDKFEMIECVAAHGLRTARQLLVTDAEELREWHRQVGGRIVVKPLRSTASDGVSFCETPEQAVAAYEAILGREDVFSHRNEGAVAQEYLVGAEYMVNTVSRSGRHHVTDVWGSGRISLNGVTDLLVESTLVDSSSHLLEPLSRYAFGVLEALGIRYGPAHLELKLSPSGPCLVEAGARIAGGELPYYTRSAVGESQLDWTVDCYVRPERFDARCGEPYRIRQHFGWAAMASPHTGTIHRYRGIEAIRALESFQGMRQFVAPGEQITKTVDDTTFPLTVTLQHLSEGVVHRDLNTIRYLDGHGFYELEGTDARRASQ